MKITSLELGPFAARCLLLADETTGAAAIVDPGFEVGAALAEAARQGVTIETVVLTHAHLDHAYGVAEVRDAWPSSRLILHAADLPLYHNQPMQAQLFGFPPPRPVPEDALVADRDTLAVGTARLTVRHCPGHSPGHIVLIGETDGRPCAVVGDVLFAGSVGRTDLWGGSFAELEHSIRTVLYALPDETIVFPGHGPETTIGAERASNPFVTG